MRSIEHFLTLPFFLKVLCQLPIRQAVFQPVSRTGRSGGDGAKQPAPTARLQGDECPQHRGGEPQRPGEGVVGAGPGGEGPRPQTQSGTHLLQGRNNELHVWFLLGPFGTP